MQISVTRFDAVVIPSEIALTRINQRGPGRLDVARLLRRDW